MTFCFLGIFFPVGFITDVLWVVSTRHGHGLGPGERSCCFSTLEYFDEIGFAIQMLWYSFTFFCQIYKWWLIQLIHVYSYTSNTVRETKNSSLVIVNFLWWYLFFDFSMDFLIFLLCLPHQIFVHTSWFSFCVWTCLNACLMWLVPL